MSLEIKWSDEATETFDAIVSFIDYKWSNKEAGNFVKRTQQVLALISKNPEIYKASIENNVRQAVITSQTSLFYEIHDSHITLLFFWDNRQEPIL